MNQQFSARSTTRSIPFTSFSAPRRIHFLLVCGCTLFRAIFRRRAAQAAQLELLRISGSFCAAHSCHVLICSAARRIFRLPSRNRVAHLYRCMSDPESVCVGPPGCECLPYSICMLIKMHVFTFKRTIVNNVHVHLRLFECLRTMHTPHSRWARCRG